MPYPQLERLVGVMHRLRRDCPWDAEQTHASLVHYLIEECLEVVEAIEDGDDAALREELGDVLLQVLFHAEIAGEQGRFDIEQVARAVADKLIDRHPYVFGDQDVPADMMGAWEQRKRQEKGRTSALDGIPTRMSALARTAKVIGRSDWHGIDIETLLPSPEADDFGGRIVRLVAECHAAGIDPEQATRAALRSLQERILAAEANAGAEGGPDR